MRLFAAWCLSDPSPTQQWDKIEVTEESLLKLQAVQVMWEVLPWVLATHCMALLGTTTNCSSKSVKRNSWSQIDSWLSANIWCIKGIHETACELGTGYLSVDCGSQSVSSRGVGCILKTETVRYLCIRVDQWISLMFCGVALWTRPWYREWQVIAALFVAAAAYYQHDRFATLSVIQVKRLFVCNNDKIAW